MQIVVVGAAGGVGQHVVRLAAEREWSLRAVARSMEAVPVGAGVTAVSGDVRDPGLWPDLLPGADAVLWCVGVTRTSGGDVGRVSLPQLVAAMASRGVDRFVGVSGAGVTLPDDRKGPGARFVSGLTRQLAGDLVGDKEAEHAVLAGSPLAWTQVRPPRLTDKPGRGTYRLTDEAPGLRAAAVAKADVALAMLDLAASGAHLRAAPFLVAGPPS